MMSIFQCLPEAMSAFFIAIENGSKFASNDMQVKYQVNASEMQVKCK